MVYLWYIVNIGGHMVFHWAYGGYGECGDMVNIWHMVNMDISEYVAKGHYWGYGALGKN